MYDKQARKFCNNIALQLPPSNEVMEAIRLLQKELPEALQHRAQIERDALREKAAEATAEMLMSLKNDYLDDNYKYEWYWYIRGVRDIVYTMNAQLDGECKSKNDLEEALRVIQDTTNNK